MKSIIVDQLKEKLGNRATDSRFEASLYCRDLAPVPDLLVNPLFNTAADLIVRPVDTAEVAEILKIAWDNDIPVTPRAGASTVYFDSVPINGGIVMDLNLIKGIVALDEVEMTVTVRAGTTWSELEAYLNAKGFALRSFPSSAPVASIGGWFCMMGYGIGSVKYGSLLAQVKEIEVVLPGGEVKQLTPSSDIPLDWLAGSEGTLGVVTQLQVNIRSLTSMKHYLLKVKEPDLSRVITHIHNARVLPYNVHFSDQKHNAIMNRLGFFEDEFKDSCTITVDYEGSEDELKEADAVISEVTAGDFSAELADEKDAVREWKEKFLALRLKRGGPSQLGGEVWLPVDNLNRYLNDVSKMDKKYKLGLVSYGHSATPDHIVVMTAFFADERKTIDYVIKLSMVKKIQDIGHRYGGKPYGIGLWNTPYIGYIFESSQLAELRARKKKLDLKGIMNPGKVYQPPLLLNSFNFKAAMNVLAAVSRVAGRGNRRA